MKILVDVDELLEQGVITGETAALLRTHSLRDTGTTAINMLLAFGAVAVAAGLSALTQSAGLSAVFGLLFVAGGWFIAKNFEVNWSKLGAIWMVVGALTLCGAFAVLINKPLEAGILAALILAMTAYLAGSRLLAGLVPLAIESALGGSTGYWTACYEIVVREPTITIVVFALFALAGWGVTQRLKGVMQVLTLTFTRISIILVNMGFWVGSLWGDSPGNMWLRGDTYDGNATIPALAFVISWAVALLAAGYWAAQNGRRFLVNTVATFGAIHLYTQWFERLGADPLTVMAAGLVTIVIGLGFWKYNMRTLAARP